jgi:F0F1-type ATP synthase assembly protein I
MSTRRVLLIMATTFLIVSAVGLALNVVSEGINAIFGFSGAGVLGGILFLAIVVRMHEPTE